jgi:hypothetical protein
MACAAAVVLALLGAIAGVGCGDEDNGTAGGNETAGGGSAEAPAGSGGDEGSQSGDGEEADGGESVTTSSLSGAAYRKQLLAACEELSQQQLEELSEYAADHPDESLPERFVGSFDEIIAPGLEARADLLREVGAPAGREKQIEALAVALDEAAEAGLEEGPEGAQALRKSANARRLGEKNKLRDCVV